MIRPLLNAMRLQAERQAAARRETSVGIVTSYDPENFAVCVRLQAEGIVTGWLPVCSQWIGNGWGMFAAPGVGDMVAIEYFGAGIDAGFVVGRLFNDEDRPLATPSGEFWLVHKSLSLLKFTNDGDVIVTSARDLVATVGRNLEASVAGNLDVSVGGNASATVTGDLVARAAAATVNAPTTINGDTTINGSLHVSGAIEGDDDITAAGEIADQGGAKTMAGMREVYDTHTHDDGPVPDQPM